MSGHEVIEHNALCTGHRGSEMFGFFISNHILPSPGILHGSGVGLRGGGFTAATGPGSAGMLGQYREGHRPEGGVSLDDALVLLSLQHLESSFFSFPCKVAEGALCVGSRAVNCPIQKERRLHGSCVFLPLCLPDEFSIFQ